MTKYRAMITEANTFLLECLKCAPIETMALILITIGLLAFISFQAGTDL